MLCFLSGHGKISFLNEAYWVKHDSDDSGKIDNTAIRKRQCLFTGEISRCTGAPRNLRGHFMFPQTCQSYGSCKSKTTLYYGIEKYLNCLVDSQPLLDLSNFIISPD